MRCVVAACAVAVGVVAVGGCVDPPTAAQGPSTPVTSATRVAASTTTRTSTPSSPPATSGTTAPATAPARRASKPGTAAAALDRLEVKGRAPKTGYSRAAFPHWDDTDRDGCDADDQAVKAAADVELRDACREVAGRMVDPYSGVELRWGAKRSGVVDVDHVVALGDAWQKGAQMLSVGQRQQLANDPLNLVPTSASLNRGKGDSDAASWLPPLKSYRCQYVARQVAVKTRYRLWITSAEKTAMQTVLDACPGERLPTGGGPVPAKTATATERPSPTSTTAPTEQPRPSTPAPTDRPEPKRTTAPKPGGDNLATCADVKAAGLGPYRKGIDPEYDRYQDRDGDGVVCERS